MPTVLPSTATVVATGRVASNISHVVLRYRGKMVLFGHKVKRSLVVDETGDAVSFRASALRTQERGEARDGESGAMTSNYADAARIRGIVSDSGTLITTATESVCPAILRARPRTPQSSCRFRLSQRNLMPPS